MNCVSLIALQDLQGFKKQNGASSNMILPSSLETTLLCSRCCELGTCFEDMFRKALDLHKTKHPKHQAFTYFHAWYVLKDIP